MLTLGSNPHRLKSSSLTPTEKLNIELLYEHVVFRGLCEYHGLSLLVSRSETHEKKGAPNWMWTGNPLPKSMVLCLFWGTPLFRGVLFYRETTRRNCHFGEVPLNKDTPIFQKMRESAVFRGRGCLQREVRRKSGGCFSS